MTIWQQWQKWDYLQKAQFVANIFYHFGQAGISIHAIINNFTDYPDPPEEDNEKE